MTEEVSIPPKYYNSIIGSGGKLVKHIMDECGGVQIKFPNADSKSDKVIKYITTEQYQCVFREKVLLCRRVASV